jgi:threonine dehydratase
MFSIDDFRTAAALIRDKVIRTPVVFSPTFSRLTGARVYLKLENLQETGSFKLRGATYKILSSLDGIGPEGVVAASAGNHAQGVALAAKRAGLKATVVMPEWASITKQEATIGYGGEVVLEGRSLGESIRKAMELAETGKTFIHPFDDRDIILGQGTIGLEIFEDVKEPDVIVVPIGGGGLISGIASAARLLRPDTRIVGVQAKACPSASEAISAGMPVRVESARSLADGISVKQIGALNYPIIRQVVGDIVLVDEDHISAAILMLLERKRVLAEGAGAAALAALLGSPAMIGEGSCVVLVISGGNVDSSLLDRVIRQGIFRSGRILRLSVVIEDVPGSLAGLLTLVGRLKANVLHIYHDRGGRDMPVHLTRVELELETRGKDHIKSIASRLEASGYSIQPSPCSQIHF